MSILILIFTGFFVGILGAVLGLGGGIVIVPILAIILNMPIHEAIAVSLIAITANSLSTSTVYIKNGLANLNLGLLMAIGSVLGAIIGSYIAISIPAATVMLILGCMQLLIAYLTYYRSKSEKQYIPAPDNKISFFGSSYTEQSTGEVITYKTINVFTNTIFSFLSGIFSGLTGAGGGILLIPGMNLISRLPIKAATATSTFVVGFTAAAGSIVYLASGFVNPSTVGAIIIGIFFGTVFSMKYFTKFTDKKVTYLFIGLLLIVSIQMIYRGLNEL